MSRTSPIKGYGTTSVMRIAENPLKKLQNNRLRVKLFSASMNPIDLWMRAGYGKSVFPFLRGGPSKEYCLGRDGYGEIVEIGSNIWNWKVGERVVVSTSPSDVDISLHSDYVDVCVNHIAKAPHSDISSVSKGSFPFSGLTAWSAARKTAPGDSVLVLGGSGPVGQILLQLLKHRNCSVFTSCSKSDFSLCESLGAEKMFAYDQNQEGKPFSELEFVSSLLERLGDHSCSTIIDASPLSYIDETFTTSSILHSWVTKSKDARSFNQSLDLLRLLKPGGSYSTLTGGLIRTLDHLNPLMGLPAAFGNLAAINWIARKNFGVSFDWVLYENNPIALQELSNMVEKELIRPPTIASIFQFPDDLDKAYKDLQSKQVPGKVMLKISQD